MSLNAKSKILKPSTSSKEQLVFQSEISLSLAYLFVRVAPLVAFVFYFTTPFWTLLTALGLSFLLLWAARQHNYRFVGQANNLQIAPSFWSSDPPIHYSYSNIQAAAIKISSRQDKRQWLALKDQTGQWRRFRCDWLHEQDPPSVDEHEDTTPQHELFELLDEEDFYQGSIQHLAYFLQQKGISVHLET